MTDPQSDERHPRTRHVMVTVDCQHVPGLLLKWRRVQNGPPGWEGFVIVAHAQDGNVSQRWVLADQIEPVG